MPKETGPPFPPGHATPLPNLRHPESHTNIPLQVRTGPPREFPPENPGVPPVTPPVFLPVTPPGQFPNPGGQGGEPYPTTTPTEPPPEPREARLDKVVVANNQTMV